MRLRLWFVALGVSLLFGSAGAQLQIRSVTLEGCEVTKPEAVLEVANIHEGMEFDEQKICQALLELGLFDSVTVQHEALPISSCIRTMGLAFATSHCIGQKASVKGICPYGYPAGSYE